MAYECFIKTYKHNARHQHPSVAFNFTQLYEMSRNEIETASNHAEFTRSAWFGAIHQYMKSLNLCSSLYDRCKAEDTMRIKWSQFKSTVIYLEPLVPPLPE